MAVCSYRLRVSTYKLRLNYLSTFSTNSSCQLDILGHNGDTLGVDGAQVGVFKQTNQVGLRCFLKGTNGCALETEISLEILSDLTNETLEREFPDEQFSGFLVPSDFTKGDGTGPVPMGLLDSSGGWGRFTGGLGGQLLTRGLASGRLTGGLLGTSHDSTNI